MNRVAIIKGMWGDESLARRKLQPPKAFHSVRNGVERSIRAREMVDGVYCFGEDNREWLSRMRARPRMLDARPWASPHRPGVGMSFRFRWAGAIRDGYSYWWHKFKIMEAALKEYPKGVLWVDFDVRQVGTKERVLSLLQDLEQGPPVRASLYVQHNWTWGSGWRHDSGWEVGGTEIAEGDHHTAARIVMGCGFLFIRELGIVQEMLRIQDEFSHFLDHQIVSLWFDRMQGGQWIGINQYLAEGWHTKGYYYGRQLFPPDLNQIVYQAGDLRGKVTL